jgi:ankyrin repeat protein
MSECYYDEAYKQACGMEKARVDLRKEEKNKRIDNLRANAKRKIEEANTRYFSYLMNATKKGVISAVINLIEAKEDLDAQDSNGKTALMYAIENQNSGIVKLLIRAGADLDKQDDKGNTALHFALWDHELSLVELLVTHGALEGIKNKNGESARSISEHNGLILYTYGKMLPQTKHPFE